MAGKPGRKPGTPKTGGRIAGTPNRKTTEIMELMDSLGCNPIEGMATIALDMNNPPDLRGRMHAELAQYIYPKRKAMELSGSVDAGQGWAEILRSRRAARAAKETNATPS